jgi:hypothetical protein
MKRSQTGDALTNSGFPRAPHATPPLAAVTPPPVTPNASLSGSS